MAETILVLTHADESGSALTAASLEAVTAGMELAARLDASMGIGIVAVDANAAAGVLAGVSARIFAVSGEALGQPRYASDAAACEALCKVASATIVLAPGSSRFARVAAGVAHRLGGCVDTHITSVGGEDDVEVSRWFYRQRIEGVITRSARPWFLLLDAGTHVPFAGTVGEVQVEQIAVSYAGVPHHGYWNSCSGAGCANDPAGGEDAVCCRRGMDQEAIRRKGARGRGRRTDIEFSK